MIKKCNNDNLTAKDIDPRFFLFYQLWKEMTEVKTLDTYQYKIMNTLSSLQELGMIIVKRLNRHYNTNHNIEECKLETLQIIKNDSVMKDYYPKIWQRLMAHLSEKTDTDSQQRALRYQIEYCYNILRKDYFGNLIASLEKDILSSDIDNIIQKTNQAISNCASLGWSTTALHNVVDILHNSNTDTSRWTTFKERLLSTKLDLYHILIPLKVRVITAPKQANTSAEKKVIEEIIDMGIPIKDSTEIVSEYSYIRKIENGQKYLVVEVFANDYYSASHIAITKCANILNLLSFYNLIEAWNIRDISWHAVNSELKIAKSLKSKDLYGTYDYMEGANRIFKCSKKIDKQDGNSIKAKLRATYSYSNMGKASYAQEEKFINTWVALESLCRSDVYDNIISNVLETVPPALCLRYIYRFYRNFVEDCIRCDIDFSFSTVAVLVKHPSKETIVESIISVIKDDILFNELLEKCKVNDLLYQRCLEMRRLTVDINTMFSKIEKHYVNVRRQLSRLYRLRNEIAHSAMNDEISLIRYIEHMNDFLATFVSEVVMCSEIKSEDSIEIVFEIIKDNYREFCDIKSSRKGANATICLNRLFETGIIDLV